MIRRLLAFFLFVPYLAFAAPVSDLKELPLEDPIEITAPLPPPLAVTLAPPPPSVGSFLLGFLTPSNVGMGLVALVSLLGGLGAMTEVRKRRIALAAYHAFMIVEDIGREREGKDPFDKAAEYLRQLNAVLVAKGWRALKPGEVAAAALEGQAMHGAEIAKQKVAEAAALAQVAAANLRPS